MHERRASVMMAFLPTVAMAFFLVGGAAGWFLAGRQAGGRPDDLAKVH